MPEQASLSYIGNNLVCLNPVPNIFNKNGTIKQILKDRKI
jgi:hypothetical protein